MPNSLKIINTLDKISDCLPLVSTVTGLSQYIYKQTHATQEAASPILHGGSIKDDFKIHALTKQSRLRFAMIPIIGNFYAAFIHLKQAFTKAFGKKDADNPTGYLGNAIKNNNSEVVSLYLARNPEISDHKLIKNLKLAVKLGHNNLVPLLLHNREATPALLQGLSTKEIREAPAIANVINQILQKNELLVTQLIDCIKEADQSGAKLTDAEWLEKFAPEKSGNYLEIAADKQHMTALQKLLKHSKINEADQFKAFNKISKNKDLTLLDEFIKLSPKFFDQHPEELLKQTVNDSFLKGFERLETRYKEKISTSRLHKLIGESLELVTKDIDSKSDQRISIANYILVNYSNLPVKHLKKSLELASKLKTRHIYFYLNFAPNDNGSEQANKANKADKKGFKTIKPKDVKDLYDKALEIISDEGATADQKIIAQNVRNAITTKFPNEQDLY